MLGVAEITFIGPVDMSLAEINHNNASIILRIKYGSTSFLFTGDAEIEEELSVIGTNAELQSTLLKVGHHGSYAGYDEDDECYLLAYENEAKYPGEVIKVRSFKVQGVARHVIKAL